MRVFVVGAGGVGGYFGGRLAEAGHPVTFLVRARRAEQLSSTGMVIESPLGDARIAAHAETSAIGLELADIVILACKAYDLPSAMEAMAPIVGPNTVVLPLLNGVDHLETLAARFPNATVWGGMVHLGVTMTTEGTIRHLNALNILTFGSRNGQADVRAEPFQALFKDTPVHTKLSPNIDHDLWGKFVFLSALAGMTCAMRANVGAIVATPDGTRMMLQLLEECIAVAGCNGYALPPDQMDQYRAQLTQRGSPSKASMLRDIEQGARTEGEHVLGDMLRRGLSAGLKTPLLEFATTHLRAYDLSRVENANPRT